MTFNTRAFNKYQWIDIPDIGDKIMTFVKEQDADILCFQEFNYSRAMEFDQYPYHYVEYIFLEQPRVVQGILSKYPIVQKGSLDFPQSHNNASFADVVYKQDTIRIYNVHLESLRIDPHTDAIINEVSGKLVNRMSKAFSKQEEQANILAEHQQTTTFNKIVCGDFNTTQYSKAYRIIKGPLQDTFTQKGEGFGRTYDLNYFPLRIDFMLVDEAFEITSHNNVDVTLSDHYPVISTLRLREE